jgi:hypothetical protein
MARISGIGGVFFKANDPKALAAWYAEHLGLALEDFGGAVLRWPQSIWPEWQGQGSLPQPQGRPSWNIFRHKGSR